MALTELSGRVIWSISFVKKYLFSRQSTLRDSCFVWRISPKSGYSLDPFTAKIKTVDDVQAVNVASVASIAFQTISRNKLIRAFFGGTMGLLPVWGPM